MTNAKNHERYYVAVRPQTNEIHSVHREGCPFMPVDNKRIYLGKFMSTDDAGREGRKFFDSSSGCRFCSHDSYIEKREPVRQQVNSNYTMFDEKYVSSGMSKVLSLLN